MQGTGPAVRVRSVTDGWNDEQFPGASRRDVRETDALLPVARHLRRFVIKQLQRLPPAEPHRAQAPIGINVTVRRLPVKPACRIRQNHDRELQSLRAVDRHQTHAIAAFFENGRLPSLARSGLFPQVLDESPERQSASRLEPPRQFGNLQHVGKSLFSGWSHDEPCVRTGRLEQPTDRRGHWHVVALMVQRLQQVKRIGDRNERRVVCLRRSQLGAESQTGADDRTSGDR